MSGGTDEPLDLRLVPTAAAVWSVAAFAVVLSENASRVAGTTACVVAVAIAVAVLARRGRRVGSGRGPLQNPTPMRDKPAGTRGRSAVEARTAAAGQLVLVFGAVGALLLATSGQIRAREAGDLRGLAEAGSTVRIVGLVRSTPELVGGAPSGATEAEDTTTAPASGVVRFLLAARSVEVAGLAAASVPALTEPAPATARPSGAAVEVWAPASSAGLAYGTQIEVVVRLSPVKDRARRPVVRARAVEDPTIRAGPPRLLAATEALRTGLARTATGIPGDAGRLLPAVAVGDMRSVGDLEEAMRASGLAHLTAVSGAHFSLVGGVVLALAAQCRVARRWRWLPVAGVMVGFVALVHPGASVVRAAVMGAIGVLGLVAGRPTRSVPALAGAVLVLLVVDPWLARDLGFVLSVVATAGIVLLAGPLAGPLAQLVTALRRTRTRARTAWAARRGMQAGGERPVRPARSAPRTERRQPPTLALALAVPVAAQAVCAPVVLLLAPTVPTYAVLANVLVAPAVAPATIGGLLAALLGPWWAAGAAWCAQIAGAACWWIAAVARTASGLPGAQIAWAGGAVGPVLLACASGAVLVLVLRCRYGVAP